MRASWVPAVLCVAVLFPTSGNAQPDKVPEPVPLVTAANADWLMRGEPIFYNGNFYWPSGPTIFFDGAVLVRTGQYDGVPLYADPFLQPYSVVYVPIGGNVVRPYVRRQAGPGTVGPTGGPNAYVAPNLEPLVIPESAGTGTPGAVGTGGSIVPRPATGVETLAIERGRTARTAVRSIPGPQGNRGIWLTFNGARYQSAGPAVSFSADRFVPIGEYHGSPVYRENGGRSNVIFVPSVKGGPLAPYKR